MRRNPVAGCGRNHDGDRRSGRLAPLRLRAVARKRPREQTIGCARYRLKPRTEMTEPRLITGILFGFYWPILIWQT